MHLSTTQLFRKTSLAPAAALCSLLLAAPADAAHRVCTWNTNAVGNWSTASNWSGDCAGTMVPNNGADTFDVTISSGSATLDQDVTIQKLDLQSGTIGGGSDLTLADEFT